MKIRIIIFMLLLYAIGVASKAQSPYYYYGRDKIFMEADHDKVGVLIPNGKERSVMRLDAIESVILPFETNSISNSRYRISFVDLKDFNKENKSDKISALKKAVEKYGAMKGGYLALRRILRCNPFHRQKSIQYDPVP